jgi:hypothetical protein
MISEEYKKYREYKKYCKLSTRYFEALEKIQLNIDMSSDEADNLLENIKKDALKLRESVTYDDTRKAADRLIGWCNNSSYSHRIFIENKEFIVLQTKDTKEKYVMIKTDTIGKNNYIDTCPYDDAIKRREAVRGNNYLTKIKVNATTAIKASDLLMQVRANNGNYTTLYGHKEVRTTWADNDTYNDTYNLL